LSSTRGCGAIEAVCAIAHRRGTADRRGALNGATLNRYFFVRVSFENGLY
jgi:hypothetical protein